MEERKWGLDVHTFQPPQAICTLQGYYCQPLCLSIYLFEDVGELIPCPVV
jgi:hypothetical protein